MWSLTKSFQETFINGLTTNIMEAVLEDERLENFDNAETGLILAKYVHTPEYDDREAVKNKIRWKFHSIV